ncbi:MAG: trmB [Frankiales bacterium]|nr:trmB [Frankiales bacterium]
MSDTIRSYRHRRGRMGATTTAVLGRLGDRIVAVDGSPLDPTTLFSRAAPLVVEVGSGMGEATAAMAAADPGRNLLAVDVHLQGLGRLLRRIEEQGLTNVRVAEGDAVVLLRDMLPPDSVDEVRVFFPDPWPKSRHAKRRLVQQGFLDVVATRLRAGGMLHVATDWTPYAEQVAALVRRHPSYVVVQEGPRPASRPVTRFEQQGLDVGRASWDLLSRRV